MINKEEAIKIAKDFFKNGERGKGKGERGKGVRYPFLVFL